MQLYQRLHTPMTWLGWKYLQYDLCRLATMEKTGLRTDTHDLSYTVNSIGPFQKWGKLNTTAHYSGTGYQVYKGLISHQFLNLLIQN